ncbi:MAG: efflux transporter outer membrane subunit [Acidobacteria bacterium]|nr:MAG: efflux transporter outer membrane subunit [Acidobacteriota bacterium]
MKCVSGISGHRALRLTLTMALLTGLACVKLPPQDLVEINLDRPERWQQEDVPSAADPPEDAWWMTFNDARLAEIIEHTLEANHDLQAAVARVAQAVAAARIVSADLKPTVGVGLAGGRQRQNFVGFPVPGGGSVLSTTSTRYGVSLDVFWEADLWGRLQAGTRAALADVHAITDDVEFARQSLAAQAAKAWFSAVEAREQVELSAGTVASRRESRDQVNARYRLGLRPPLELRLAESTLADAQALEALRRSQLNGSVRQLEILMGLYPSGTFLAADDHATLPPPPPSIPAGLPADLLQRRPDLRAAASRVQAADQRTLSAKRALYPRLTLTASGGTVTQQLQDLVQGDFRVWSLLGGLTQPLFQGGRLRAGVRLADAVGDESLELYASSVLRAFAEVETALADENWLRDQESALAFSSDQLAAAQRLALQRYSNGVGDFLTVLESQRREFLARSALLAVRRQRLANRVNLFLALGGGFGDNS